MTYLDRIAGQSYNHRGFTRPSQNRDTGSETLSVSEIPEDLLKAAQARIAIVIDIGHIPAAQPLRIIIGAGQQSYPGWLATQKEQLDLLRREDWDASFGARPIDALLCEHVWEHLTEQQGREA